MALMTVRFGSTFDEVLASAQAGGGWAFERLYAWLAPAVASYVRGQGLPDADDAVGDVFLKAFTSIGGFRGTEEQFRSWVFTVAHHRIVDERRRERRRPPACTTLDAVAEEEASGRTEDIAISAISLATLRSVVDSLPADQRDVLLMRVLGDLTVEQTAQSLGKTAGAVKQLQRRALLAARAAVEARGVTL